MLGCVVVVVVEPPLAGKKVTDDEAMLRDSTVPGLGTLTTSSRLMAWCGLEPDLEPCLPLLAVAGEAPLEG